MTLTSGVRRHEALLTLGWLWRGWKIPTGGLGKRRRGVVPWLRRAELRRWWLIRRRRRLEILRPWIWHWWFRRITLGRTLLRLSWGRRSLRRRALWRRSL